MLRSLGRAEVDDIVREQSQVEVGCEFCGLRYRFDPVDVGELFAAPRRSGARLERDQLSGRRAYFSR